MEMTAKDKEIAAVLDALAIEGTLMRAKAQANGPDWDYSFACEVLGLYIRVNEAFLGLRELPGNRGYFHDQFARALGQPLGIPYCIAGLDWTAHFTAGIAGIPDFFPMDTASTQQFYAANKKRGFTMATPTVGAISVWRQSLKPWQGHVALVPSYGPARFETIEFNTSDPASQWREGLFVMRKEHGYSKIGQIVRGRVLRGFVNTRQAIEASIAAWRAEQSAALQRAVEGAHGTGTH